MTQRNDSVIEGVLKVLTENGLEEGLVRAVETILNQAMVFDRSQYLKAQPYERTENRVDYGNGYKPKTLKTRIGAVDLSIPQTRNGGYYPEFLEKGLRSERALFNAMAEMYIQGVSTRNVTKILDDLCGLQVSSSQISKIAKTLDDDLFEFRNRELGACEFMMADARYEKVRYGGKVQDLAVIWAIGVKLDGQREILGVSVSLSEAEVHWRAFFQGLVKRGLHGLSYAVSDDHPGLTKALTSVFKGIIWNRCHTHLAHNAQGYVSKQTNKADVAQGIRDILTAPDIETAQHQLDRFISHWEKQEPKLCEWAELNIPEGFAVFNLPRKIRRNLRTSNLIERMNQELKRRSRVIRIFPNESSCLRLMSALLLEIHEEWASGRRLFSVENLSVSDLATNQIYRKNVA